MLLRFILSPPGLNKTNFLKYYPLAVLKYVDGPLSVHTQQRRQQDNGKIEFSATKKLARMAQERWAAGGLQHGDGKTALPSGPKGH